MAVELTVSYNSKGGTAIDADKAAVAAEIVGADLYRIKVRGALFELGSYNVVQTILDSLGSLRRVESFHTVGNKHVVTVHPWRA